MRKQRLYYVIAPIAAATAVLSSVPAKATETQAYAYDELGRLVSVTSSGTVNNGQKHSICYDAADSRTVYKSDSAGAGAACTPAPPPPPPPAPSPSIAINDASGTEATVITFTVTLSASSTSTVTVNYATATGTAVALDFTATSGTLTFAPGQTSKTIPVTTKTDAKVEVDEYFTVNLTSPVNATIGDGQGQGTIFDDGLGGCTTC